MTLSIDFNGIKNSILATYHTFSEKTSQWLGRLVGVIKSSSTTALPYLQDKRIAAASLIAVNIILIQLGKFFGFLVEKCFPDRTERQRALRDMVIIPLELGVLIGGVMAFTKYTQLPFNWLVVTAISVVTFVIYASLFENSY
jgi:hypothetical protein